MTHHRAIDEVAAQRNIELTHQLVKTTTKWLEAFYRLTNHTPVFEVADMHVPKRALQKGKKVF